LLADLEQTLVFSRKTVEVSGRRRLGDFQLGKLPVGGFGSASKVDFA